MFSTQNFDGFPIRNSEFKKGSPHSACTYSVRETSTSEGLPSLEDNVISRSYDVLEESHVAELRLPAIVRHGFRLPVYCYKVYSR